ncbi:tripartite tricarboxylate transporter substrate binding protein [Anaerotalea alkaliphila]|nr:tripartite tricarboxylate transporter substrate binding protein [Anaerotalea alkaliphila]
MLAMVMMLGLAGCSTTNEQEKPGAAKAGAAEPEAFAPEKIIEWIVTSSAGGGSDIFSRSISDILSKKDLVPQNVVVYNQTDGGGEVGRRKVSMLKNEAHTLLTFNTGDLQGMLENTQLKLKDFTPLAIMALDGQILLVKDDSKHQSIEEIIAALEGGESFIIGGSKSDDEHVYKLFKENIGGDAVEYMRFDSTGDVLTSLLGGHVDIAIGKPAASTQYIESKDMKAIATFGSERFGGVFADAPTFLELGYEDIRFEIYRGIVGPADMPQEAVDYWVETLETVTETEEWRVDYIDKFLLLPSFKGGEEAREYMQKVEDEILENM